MRNQKGLRFDYWNVHDYVDYLMRRGMISERDAHDADEIHRWYETWDHDAKLDRNQVRRAIRRIRAMAVSLPYSEAFVELQP